MRPIVQFKEVHYRYRSERAALSNVSFDIIANRRTAIVGANGAGKSTAVFHLNGLFQPSSGEVWFRGEPVTKRNRERMVDHVGIVFQDPDDQIISLTVYEDIAFGLVQRGIAREEVDLRTQHYLALLGITELANRHPGELSLGQKKLVAIAGVLALETELVVFDEPMAFLDPHGKKEIQRIMEMLSEMGRTVIVTTHDMQLVAEWAEDVIVMREGACAGVMSPGELFANRSLVAQTKLELPPIAELASALWDGEPRLMPIRMEELKRWLEQKLAANKLAPLFTEPFCISEHNSSLPLRARS
ncbi:energy-coupling factor ABC transporter ATP-binding protein [Paenibacillus abyssi]|uniref:Cobalt ABC transporter ATP-binding protein n=1 Tax=Paenibacillus abyssi TaxID=1340531 RepID=A0A917CWX5_9BACL|nr:ABC transporter ATP-binding protein [Paenibacillus abyssi]GGG01198.1 cobalt ABC transporter ATP-binding protein [Paenibacillus abyssi]